MGFLTERSNKSLEYKGKVYKVNPAFDTVLRIQNLFDETGLSERDKIMHALSMLLTKGRIRVKTLSLRDKTELLNRIYDQFVKGPKKPHRNEPAVLDFEADGEYIYSSFLFDYGIDLKDEQGKLEWRKFIALFQGLSEHTKIREIMRIRRMDIPAYNGHNSKEIQNIRELKSFYSLPIKGGGGEKGLDRLFSALEAMATREVK